MEFVRPDTCLLPGYALQLEVDFDRGEDEQTTIYPSMIIGLEPDVLYVDIPRYHGQTFKLPDHTAVHGLVQTDDALYTFDSEVIGYELDVPVAMCLKVPETVLCTQRRGAVRVPADLPMRFRTGDVDLMLEMRDISAGGMSFFSPKVQHSMLDIGVNLAGPTGSDWLEVKGLVRRCAPVDHGYLVAVSFVELNRRDEDRVIAYLFRRQRQMLRTQGN